MLGAVVIVGSGNATGSSSRRPHSGMPLACVEVLGRSALDRQIAELRKPGLDSLVLLADQNLAPSRLEFEQATNVSFTWAEDLANSSVQQLAAYKQSGFRTVFVIRATSYAELDFGDFLQFHREQAVGLTRAICQEGPLDIWAVDMDALVPENLPTLLRSAEGACYWLRGYVNRLQHPRDLRRLVADSFSSKCRVRPLGYEARPGIWVSDGTDLHRGARIVAPAYIGRGSKIEEQCLITRCSNVESNCLVDYGTVVEDSTVLPNTYVGIGLDISHSMVNGNSLLHLERDVLLEISDPGVVRPNKVLRKEVNRPSSAAFGLIGMY